MPVHVSTIRPAARALRGSRVAPAIAVAIVAMAVLGMHTLGMGHGHSMTPATASTMTAGQHQSAHPGVTAIARSATEHAASVAHQALSSSAVSRAASVAANPVHAAAFRVNAAPADAMSGVMCLAILPILAWLLLRWRRAVMARRRPRNLARAGIRPAVRFRAPPPHLAPSLTRLCVARM